MFLELYRQEKGTYPTTKQGLEQLIRDGFVRPGTLFNDDWGNQIHYRYPSQLEGVPFELWSYGADGKPGGSGEDADIWWKK
jgi:general secretion pathway protein G